MKDSQMRPAMANKRMAVMELMVAFLSLTLNEVFRPKKARVLGMKLLYLNYDRENHGAAAGAVEEEVFQNVGGNFAHLTIRIYMPLAFGQSNF